MTNYEAAIKEIKPVYIPGSEGYWNSYEQAKELGERFPHNEAYDFLMACNYNDFGPLNDETLGILTFVCTQEGENDSLDWEWVLVLSDLSVWKVKAWCDYTGWDCMSGIEWTKLSG